MFRTRMLARLWFLSAVLVPLGGCADKSAGDCIPGTLLCECVGNICQVGLICASNFCVDPNSASSGNTNESLTTAVSTTLGQTDDGGEPLGGPVIEQLVADPDVLLYPELLIFTAVVSDPDGLEDIKSGQLFGPTWTVGFFQNIGGGTWSVATTWQDVKDDAGGLNKNIVFRAEFTDELNQVGTQEISVLACEIGYDPCPNGCRDLNTDEECGACGVPCGNGQFCDEGMCENFGGSFVPP